MTGSKLVPNCEITISQIGCFQFSTEATDGDGLRLVLQEERRKQMPAPSVTAVLVRCSWNVTIIGARKIQCHYLSYRSVGRHTWNATSVLELATNIGALWIECHQYWCAVDWMPPILVRCWWNATNIGALLFEYWCAEDGMPLLCLCSVARMWPMLVRCRWNHSIGMPPICTRKTTFFGEGALLHLLSALLCWDFSLNWRCTRRPRSRVH